MCLRFSNKTGVSPMWRRLASTLARQRGPQRRTETFVISSALNRRDSDRRTSLVSAVRTATSRSNPSPHSCVRGSTTKNRCQPWLCSSRSTSRAPMPETIFHPGTIAGLVGPSRGKSPSGCTRNDPGLSSPVMGVMGHFPQHSKFLGSSSGSKTKTRTRGASL
jgi:hypothetical protein